MPARQVRVDDRVSCSVGYGNVAWIPGTPIYYSPNSRRLVPVRFDYDSPNTAPEDLLFVKVSELHPLKDERSPTMHKNIFDDPEVRITYREVRIPTNVILQWASEVGDAWRQAIDTLRPLNDEEPPAGII